MRLEFALCVQGVEHLEGCEDGLVHVEVLVAGQSSNEAHPRLVGCHVSVLLIQGLVGRVGDLCQGGMGREERRMGAGDSKHSSTRVMRVKRGWSALLCAPAALKDNSQTVGLRRCYEICWVARNSIITDVAAAHRL